MSELKFDVTVMEFTDPDNESHSRETWHEYTGITIAHAWRICERHARRGFNRFGGNITKNNWGIRGGNFPHNYRAATIRLHGSR